MVWYCIDCGHVWDYIDDACPECGSLNFERRGKDQIDKIVGLYHKYYVERTDGSSSNGKKHEYCKYFVIDMTHDKFAADALLAYSIACKDKFPVLSNELREFAESKGKKQHRTQCEGKRESPWCSSCKEKDCEVSFDGECEMIRKYLRYNKILEANEMFRMCYNDMP